MKARNSDPIVESRLSEAFLSREWLLPEEQETWTTLSPSAICVPLQFP